MNKNLRWTIVDAEHLDVTNVSCFSGRDHTLRIKARPSQFAQWSSGALIQDAFPNLTQEEREFLVSGLTVAEWNELFGE